MKAAYDASDEVAVEKAAEDAKNKRDKVLDAVRAVAATPEGAAYLRYLMEANYLTSITFQGNSWSNYNEGRRAVALQIFSDVAEACPEKILKVILTDEAYPKVLQRIVATETIAAGDNNV